MKFLKILLIIIVLLVLVFFLKGFISPSISYQSEITVDKSVEEAWAVMNDQSKTKEWLKGMTKMEHISGEAGTVGAVTKYTYNDNGTESEIIETMKAVRPNEHVAMDFLLEGVMKMDYRMDMSEKDGKTVIKSSTTTEGIGTIMRSMVSFMKGAMQKQEDENMNNLKKLINENKTNYFQPVVEEWEPEVEELQ